MPVSQLVQLVDYQYDKRMDALEKEHTIMRSRLDQLEVYSRFKVSLGIEVTPVDVSTAHRLPRAKDDKVRPIIARSNK